MELRNFSFAMNAEEPNSMYLSLVSLSFSLFETWDFLYDFQRLLSLDGDRLPLEGDLKLNNSNHRRTTGGGAEGAVSPP